MYVSHIHIMGMVQKENSEFKPAVLCLKIDLVSHPVCGRMVE